ncbi:MAG: protein-glutamate O-methyltransferase CheR [Burkholderiaceae bacterium]|nr:protein-glutamate O-methyltransferase CheR [Rhodoferax sp.]MCP5285194.1 protein-glutamate O-methyltransferase CheR [Burkholderiaceae bacterium]
MAETAVLQGRAGTSITAADFDRLRRFFEAASGIRLADHKRELVCGRLAKRLRERGVDGYGAYLRLIELPAETAERQMAIDLLTTNETHFFREPRHFEVLRAELAERLARGQSSGIRVWSAACSTGEEPYSLAMTLDEVLGRRPWRVFASDLSQRVLADARRGVFSAQRAAEVPRPMALKYLLEGTQEYAGTFLVDAEVRQRVDFAQVNLMAMPAGLGPFDVVFLRNVLIYFDVAAKRRIVQAVLQRMAPGGLLFVGHSESLNGVVDGLRTVVPTVYRKP